MGLLDELFRVESGDAPVQRKSVTEEEVIVNKNAAAVGGGGSPTGAIPAKCPHCREIIALTPRVPDFTCRCGITYSLPKG